LKSGFVAVAGRPNVGKSTLVNALAGGKVAIVSDKPQTTRRRVMGIANGEDHQLVLDVELTQKSCDQCRLLLLTSGEKPYGHPPLPSTRGLWFHFGPSRQTVCLLFKDVK